jgi:hypothetical protein
MPDSHHRIRAGIIRHSQEAIMRSIDQMADLPCFRDILEAA